MAARHARRRAHVGRHKIAHHAARLAVCAGHPGFFRHELIKLRVRHLRELATVKRAHGLFHGFQHVGGVAHVFCVALRFTPWIVNHQESGLFHLDFVARARHHGRHACRDAHDVRNHMRLAVLDHVGHGQSGNHAAAGRIDLNLHLLAHGAFLQECFQRIRADCAELETEKVYILRFLRDFGVKLKRLHAVFSFLMDKSESIICPLTVCNAGCGMPNSRQ